MLVNEYKLEGVREINLAKTEQEARDRILAVEKKWDPIWKAWKTLKIAHDAWAGVIESCDDYIVALLKMKDAYCGLVKVWPDAVPAIPIGASCVRSNRCQMSTSIDQVLDSLAKVASSASVLPAPIGSVAQIIGMALTAASAIAKAGKDPVIEIKRILSADPLIQQVHSEWDKLIEEKFHKKSDPGSLPPADDPYVFRLFVFFCIFHIYLFMKPSILVL